MQVPLEITYDGIPRSPWVDDYIDEQARRLDHMCDDLMSCQVVVARLQHHKHTGNSFRARVKVTIPPKKDLIGDKRGQVEDPQVQVRLFPAQDYGFIKSPSDEQEYFFHRNAVLHGDFDRLEPGTVVRFESEMGEDGPQAGTVQIISKPGVRAGRGEEKACGPPAGWEST